MRKKNDLAVLLSYDKGNVTLYNCLGKISDYLYPNNKNNQLKRRVWPPRDIS